MGPHRSRMGYVVIRLDGLCQCAPHVCRRHCPARATHIGALINLTKTSLAFGVSYTPVSWMEGMGPVPQFGIMAGLLWLVYLLLLPLWLYRMMVKWKTSTTLRWRFLVLLRINLL
jgi:hypothetical protein